MSKDKINADSDFNSCFLRNWSLSLKRCHPRVIQSQKAPGELQEILEPSHWPSSVQLLEAPSNTVTTSLSSTLLPATSRPLSMIPTRSDRVPVCTSTKWLLYGLWQSRLLHWEVWLVRCWPGQWQSTWGGKSLCWLIMSSCLLLLYLYWPASWHSPLRWSS